MLPWQFMSFFAGAGGNRYSFIYSGDINGDATGNDPIYIPRNQGEILFDPLVRGATTTHQPSSGPASTRSSSRTPTCASTAAGLPSASG